MNTIMEDRKLVTLSFNRTGETRSLGKLKKKEGEKKKEREREVRKEKESKR